MKIALISDLHGQKKTIKFVSEIISKHAPDYLIASGDLTSGGDLEFLADLFSVFLETGKRAYVIWGNSDSLEARNAISMSPYNLNLQSKKIGDFKLYGIGDYSDPIKIDPSQIAGSILVTHRPPLIETISQKLVNAPLYHISGHIHSRHTFKKFPSTTLIQVPSLQTGEYAIFEPCLDKLRFLKLPA